MVSNRASFYLAEGHMSVPFIEGFEIVSKLGEGGMSAVYRARQLLLNRTVALKVIAPRFSNDSEAVKKLKIAKNRSHNLLISNARISRFLHFANFFTSFQHLLRGSSVKPLLPRISAILIWCSIYCGTVLWGLLNDRNLPVPSRGPIQLQTLQSEVHWRNVFIREIGSSL